ncbi:MAG: sulfotransferase [Pseudomonadota bacterium]
MASIVAEEIRLGPPAGDHWANVEAVANRIGEINLGLEAARRYALSEPRTLERALHYCYALSARGRVEECVRGADLLPDALQEHPSVLELRRRIAMRQGDFALAEDLARRVLTIEPINGQNWLGLALAHTFAPGDPDLGRMEALTLEMRRRPDAAQGAFFYALGKARHDCGDYDEAFAAYREGAAAMRESYDASAAKRFADQVIADFTPQNLARLTPSGCDSDRAIFVTGIPRSGTTLVEQILASHSAVQDGEEVNLFCTALFPAGDFSLEGALAYQGRASALADPWGEIGRDYLAMLDQRFGPRGGRIVDKTLNHSRFMGLILHTLPKAKVVWLRRNPEDAAISCFRSYFGTSTVPWSWSLADIGRHFRQEDALHAHWTAFYPDRILTVPYEPLTADSEHWIKKILAHVGLEVEPGVFAPHLTKRSVQTVSARQVREPIATTSVGAAKKYGPHMQPFREAHEG